MEKEVLVKMIEDKKDFLVVIKIKIRGRELKTIVILIIIIVHNKLICIF